MEPAVVLNYTLQQSFRGLLRYKGLHGLMVLAIAMGIGASMTMLAVLHSLAGDPLPRRSRVLWHPQVDPRPAQLPGAEAEPPDDLTLQDAVNLYQLQAAPQQTMTSHNWLPLRPDQEGSAMMMVQTRANTHEMFGMFDMHFVFGGAWSAADDASRARVVVLSRALNQQLFGSVDSIGRTLQIATRTFRVVGVIDDWNPKPRFYDLNSGAYRDAEQIFLPFDTWLDLPQDYGYGPMTCWGRSSDAGTHDPRTGQCSWVQYWVQLDTPAQVAAYRQSLRDYSLQQQQLGRFERPPNVRLYSLIDWLDVKRAIPATVRMQTWIAFAVLLVCLINAVGLMSARFMHAAGEIGLRRALGAPRRAVFRQCLSDAGLVGIIGGLFGLPLTALGLWMIRQQPLPYAPSVTLEPKMFGLTLLLSLLCTLLAGLGPAWRASRLIPALQVKSL